ncbi:MAG: type II toxin-antitoxin system RelE/ParE family toxin [Gemmatimonadetes bacterium]|nr:type II toxin-antitoxin system RelE/ParE family toxin [Gemmatimonadota bacterium]
MKVKFSNGFTRDIGRIRNQSIRERIEKAIEQIERIDNFTETSNIKKLRAGGNHFRIRVGPYRLGFLLENDTVVFTRCLPRQDFYRNFP